MPNVIDVNKFTPREYQFCIYEALETHDFKRIMAIWPRRCLSGNTHITMADGSWKKLKNIVPGDKVLSWDNYRFVEDTVKYFWSTGVRETVTVKVYDRPSIKCSRDHMFLTKKHDPEGRGNLSRTFSWKCASKITKVWKVALYGKTPGREYGQRDMGCYFSRAEVVDSEPEELYDIETEKNHNFVANGYVVHNSGKDVTAWNLCIRQLVRSTIAIYYVFPTFALGRKILWDAITNDGLRILDYLPLELIESRNEQLMRIKLTNGSLFQIVGSDSYDQTLIGTNPHGIVFSEFALSDPMAYSFVRPILTANCGWALIISTPRGKNYLYDLYKTAIVNTKDWFVSKLTVEDTKHITIDSINREIELGEMSEDLVQQEYYTSFSLGVEGGYYTKYIDKLRLKGQVSNVPWQTQYQVHTAWDIGVRDLTAIIFFQQVGQALHIIDYYENSKEGIEHYVEHLRSKPYMYGTHIGPHDIRNFEFSSGTTRWEKARQLDVCFEIADNISIMDGIEAVRTTLPRCWIDEQNCKKLVSALENYRQEYDSKKETYKPKPRHDKFSHGADAFRYLAVYLPKLSDCMSPEQLKRIKHQAKYGTERSGSVFGRR